MHVIGLTGGIASGKSTVSQVLREMGAAVVDTDALAHELSEPHRAGWYEIIRLFGHDILDAEGRIDRKAVGGLVFADHDKRSRLEEALHPLISQEAMARVAQAEEQGHQIVILDAPLLIEAKWSHLVDEVWLVFVPRELQLSRLMSRDGLEYEEALLRLNAQMDIEEKVRFADVLVDNRGDLSALRQQVVSLWHRLTEEKTNGGV